MFKRAIFIFAGLLLSAFILNAIMLTAGYKTGFFHRWAEEQYFGRVTEISENGFLIVDEKNNEKPVLIKKDTRIRMGREFATKEDLLVNNYVIVVGSQNNQGQVEARVIRIFNDSR